MLFLIAGGLGLILADWESFSDIIHAYCFFSAFWRRVVRWRCCAGWPFLPCSCAVTFFGGFFLALSRGCFACPVVEDVVLGLCGRFGFSFLRVFSGCFFCVVLF